ncbi:MAG: hypothetical protein LBL93_03035 [Ruminococcus sp.]|jgi:hypothetical protein|nr:hypothetical protein [Ruminococcus sp.]
MKNKTKKSAVGRYITYGLILLIPVFICMLFAKMYLMAAFTGGLIVGLICILKHREYMYEIALALFGYGLFAATLSQLLEPAVGVEFWVCILRLFNMMSIAVTIFLLMKSEKLRNREFDSWEKHEKFYNIIEFILTLTFILLMASFIAEWALDFFVNAGAGSSSADYESGRETRRNVGRVVLLVCLLFLEICAMFHLVKFIAKKGKVKHTFSNIVCLLPSILRANREEKL